SGGRERRRRGGLAVQDDPEPPLAARSGTRGPGLERPSHRARRVGHEGNEQGRDGEHRRDHQGDRRRGDEAPGHLRRRGRLDQLPLAGLRSWPLTLVILLLVFGSIVAAGVPWLLALTAVLGTLGLLSLPSRLVPMDKNVSAVVLLIGLAVGVDYALFYLRREREERAAGKGHRAALEAAAATSGRSVLISGITVIVAMA